MAKEPPKQGSNRTGTKNGPNAMKTGPIPKPINWHQVGILAGLHATQAEIAGYMGISHNTLINRYAIEHDDETLGEFVGRHRDGGKAKLRVMQMKSAEKGSVPMQIFLGKNWLGQSDKMEVTEVKENPLVLNYEDPNYESRTALLSEVGQPVDDGQRIIEAEGIDSGEDDMVRD